MNQKVFSSEEDDIIRKYYSNGGSPECQKYMEPKLLGSISRRANVLGIRFLGKIDNSKSSLYSVTVKCKISDGFMFILHKVQVYLYMPDLE